MAEEKGCKSNQINYNNAVDKSTEDPRITAWARLVRSQQLLLERIEADLKAAGLPPLRWYDVLLELHRGGRNGLRQFEIGAAVLLSKYNVSRLLDRLERMWPLYEAAINEHFAALFSKAELKQLAMLLAKVPGVAR